MRVTTASRKKRSCETRITACGICREILLEPVPRFEIEMVRRLVEQQQRRPAEQQLRQRKPHLPPARQRIGRLLERLVGEAEPAKHRRDLQIDAVSLFDAEAILQRAVALEHRIVLFLRHRCVAEPLLDGVHLVLHGRADRRTPSSPRRESSGPRVAVRPAAGSRRSSADGLMMLPLSGSSNPASIFSSVVLPAPLGPHNPTRSPDVICQVTSSRSTRSPNDLVMADSCNTDGIAGLGIRD